MKFQSMLTLKAMLGSVAMEQEGLGLMSVAHITMRDHGDVPHLDSLLGPCRYPKAMQN